MRASRHLIIGVACLALGGHALAVTPGYWLPGYYTPGADGTVSAMTVHRGRLFVAGSFERAGSAYSPGMAAWDGVGWSGIPAPAIPASRYGFTSGFSTLASFSGDLFAGGGFVLGGAADTSYVARWDGRSWSQVGAGLNGYVNTLAVYDGRLVAGGYFTMSGGDSCAHLAIWDGGRWRAPGGGTDGRIYALTTYQGHLIAAGDFDHAGTISASGVAAWDGTSWQHLGLGSFPATALCVFQDRLIVGSYYGMQAWDGTTWSSIENAPHSGVSHLQVVGGRLIVTGSFNWVGDVYAGGIAAWDGTSWSPLAEGFRSGGCNVMAEYQGDLFAGGTFTTAGGLGIRNLARWTPEGWQGPGGSGVSTSLSLRLLDGRLVANENYMGGDPPRLDLLERADGSWRPLMPPLYGDRPQVRSVVRYGNRIVAGGQFFQAGNDLLNCLAAWDGVSFSDLGAGLDPTDYVFALAVHGGDLIVAGRLGDLGGGAGSVVRWDGSAWHDMSPGLEPWISEFISVGDTLVARVSYPDVIRWWDGTSWRPFTSSVPVSGAGPDTTAEPDNVTAAVAHNGQLVASTTSASFVWEGPDTSTAAVVRWTGSDWEELGHFFREGHGARVYTLASYHGDLIVGGTFDRVNDVPASSLARWNGNEWEGMDGIPADDEVTDLFVMSDTLIVAGDFHEIGGRASDGFAAWTDGVATPDTIPPALTLGVHASPLDGRVLDVYIASSEALSPDSTTMALDNEALAPMLPDSRLARARAYLATVAAPFHHVDARTVDLAGNTAGAALDFTVTPLVAGREADFSSPDRRFTVHMGGRAINRGGTAVVMQDARTRDEYVIQPGQGNDHTEMSLAFQWRGVALPAIQGPDGAWLPSIFDTLRHEVRATATGGGRYRVAVGPAGSTTLVTRPSVLEVGRATPDPIAPGSPTGSPETGFDFTLPGSGRIRARVHDVRGRAIVTLADEVRPGGSHRVTWDGRDTAGRHVAAGLYFVTFDFAGQRVVRKLVVAP